MGIGKNNFIGFQEEQRLLEELRKELEELKKDMEKTTKKKKE
jgi:type III secretory pathway component EscV